MSKRFTDTDKYKKLFFRGLQGAYKLLWDYLYHDCNHAGIWIVDFEVAQIYLGADMQVNKDDALKYFNDGEQRIIEIDGGRKWFIKPFIEFQYGTLNDANRVHHSVLNALSQINEIKPLISSLQGAKDKDKDKYKEKDKSGATNYTDDFSEWWAVYKKGNKKNAFAAWKKNAIPPDIIALTQKYISYCKSVDRPLLDGQGFLNQHTWETEWTHEAQGTGKTNRGFGGF